ncbi:cytochrome c biogenesis protein CcsA [Prosthecobacter sp.]|uniref:cytochrome c biogenesis protein n=1 Tax=Prosthecobacter sp. TaxID=1965333 RepID=UPI002AB92C94|nr:cytochrome c biogenesis protein CcsA [Prosthecobacter sp.]MDZ4404923.1 cytochrome c biogenesis protein CcsA [Prosthecobacter sp.]
MKTLRLALFSLFAISGFVAAAELPPLDLFRDKEVVETFASIPVQESGRIKPLENLASYRLLRFRARRSIWLTDNGEMDGGKPLVDPATQKPITKEGDKPVKLSATEWLLMSWFRPDIAKTVPLFKVDNSSAIEELGLKAKAKRDQYTFAEIEPARLLLMEKMGEYREIPAKKQTPEQRMIVQLAANFLDYEMITGHFDFIRSPVGDKADALPAGIDKPVRLSKSLNALAQDIRKGDVPPMQKPWFREFGKGALGAMMSGNAEQQLRLFPPAPQATDVWHGPGEIIFGTINGEKEVDAEQLAWLALYEEVYLALPDAAKFKAASKTLLTKIQDAAKLRGEGQFVALERHSMKADYFFYAQWIFLVGFIALALTWVSPGSRFDKIAKVLTWVLLATATGYAVTGVVIRCIIMQRPPITTLYETILFIGAATALFGLVAEWITKRSLGLLVAAVGGTACMFLAIQFEASEATDTLQQLQAVLITNFWLSTHVPMINLGYSACMVAALLSQFYFIHRFCGYRSPKVLFLQRVMGDASARDSYGRFLTRVAYGFIATGLFLSLVGTVLGGIWANYSWGRFWGWDPKENGALMIVLMCLVILHARMGGYIREIGIHCCNLILGCIVIFSWFGVNQLGVGLHAYGFTDGIWPKIYGYWLSQGVLLGYGLFLAWCGRRAKNRGESDLAAATEAVGTD